MIVKRVCVKGFSISDDSFFLKTYKFYRRNKIFPTGIIVYVSCFFNRNIHNNVTYCNVHVVWWFDEIRTSNIFKITPTGFDKHLLKTATGIAVVSARFPRARF